MTKSEISTLIANDYLYLEKDIVDRILKVILKHITAYLAHGKKIELRGFGSFQLKLRKAREARNPKNGKNININDRYYIAFRNSKQLRHRLNRQK